MVIVQSLINVNSPLSNPVKIAGDLF